MSVRAVTLWHVVGLVAVVLLMAGTFTDHTELRQWGLGIALLAACLWIKADRRDAERRYQEYVQRWAHQPFEAGWAARGVSDEIKARR